MRWRIYYGDGSTFTDQDGAPWEAPRTNVQVIKTESGFQHSKDAYYWNEAFGWQGCDTAGMYDYLMSYRAPAVVLFGRSIRNEDFWALVGRAGREPL